MRNSLGIVLPMGQNRKRLMASGQWGLWASELTEYRKTFGHVELFEYRHCDRRRFVEALLLPITERKRFNQCSVIKAVHLTGAIPCLMVKLFYGIPYVLSFGYRYDEFARVEKKWFQWMVAVILTPLVCRAATAVLVPTVAIAEFVKGQGATAVTVIPNGVDTKLFRPASTEALKGRTLQQGPTLLKRRIFKVLCVGRFEPQKNLVRLIKAVHLIQTEGSDLFKRSDPFRHSIQHPLAPSSKFRKTTRDRVPNFGNIVLTLVGQGSQQKSLEDLAKKLRVPLKIIAPMPNDRLVSFYQQSDIFVLPSLVEGHPKALLEAMSCGLPVIASDIPGCTDIITDGVNGLLVEPSIEGIRDGLERLITDRSFAARLGKHARETIAKRFEKRRVLEQEIQLMNELTYQ